MNSGEVSIEQVFYAQLFCVNTDALVLLKQLLLWCRLP